MNLNEIVNRTDHHDEAAEWAAFHEFWLRDRHYQRAKLGVIGAIRRLTEVVSGLDSSDTMGAA